MENHNHCMPHHPLNCSCMECSATMPLCEDCLEKNEMIEELEDLYYAVKTKNETLEAKNKYLHK